MQLLFSTHYVSLIHDRVLPGLFFNVFSSILSLHGTELGGETKFKQQTKVWTNTVIKTNKENKSMNQKFICVTMARPQLR